MKYSVLTACASLGALMLGSAAISAAPVTLQVCAGAGAGTSCWNGNYTIQDGVVEDWVDVQTMSNGTASVDQWETSNYLNLEGWNLIMDSDPFVTNNFTITNTTGSTQVYSVTSTIGITPVIPDGRMQGSIGVTVTDNNSNGATLATSGGSIYSGIIDGTVARTLWDPVTNITTGFGSTSDSIFFGYPTREVAPESIDSSIGITIMFSLTAGDSAGITSNFDVVPVPLPAAVWLFGSGLLGLLGVSRRKGILKQS